MLSVPYTCNHCNCHDHSSIVAYQMCLRDPFTLISRLQLEVIGGAAVDRSQSKACQPSLLRRAGVVLFHGRERKGQGCTLNNKHLLSRLLLPTHPPDAAIDSPPKVWRMLLFAYVQYTHSRPFTQPAFCALSPLSVCRTRQACCTRPCALL